MSGAEQSAAMPDEIELSVVLPCLNEALTVGPCVRLAVETIRKLGIAGEVVVADNGSTDDSVAIAEREGARVVHETRPGYGSALMGGIEAARGRYIIMADADQSYDLADLERFVVKLREGYDLVMGNRLRGRIEPGAMPWHHRWIGNPVLSGLLGLLFRPGVSDAHCGMRGFSKDGYRRMQLRTTGMEFASEMVIKAAFAGLRITEIPITLHPDQRDRPPHLRSFRDGWRHLRFMLLFSPTYLFLVPGLAAMIIGLLTQLALVRGPQSLLGLRFDVHYMVVGSLLTLLGFQTIATGFFAKAYSHAARLYAPDRTLNWISRYFNLERGLIVGAVVLLIGLIINTTILVDWLRSGMGELNAVRPALLASTLMGLGVEIIFSSFFLSMLAIDRRSD